MNVRGIIGTLIWSLLLFLVISAFFFYVSFKQAHAEPSKKQKVDEVISVQEVSKVSLGVISKIQDLRS
jgi:F0F1-type ATP synthase membrane subunit a